MRAHARTRGREFSLTRAHVRRATIRGIGAGATRAPFRGTSDSLAVETKSGTWLKLVVSLIITIRFLVSIRAILMVFPYPIYAYGPYLYAARQRESHRGISFLLVPLVRPFPSRFRQLRPVLQYHPILLRRLLWLFVYVCGAAGFSLPPRPSAFARSRPVPHLCVFLPYTRDCLFPSPLWEPSVVSLGLPAPRVPSRGRSSRGNSSTATAAELGYLHTIGPPGPLR